MRVAVIGLGTMGAPMARHLLAAGHEVAVHNRTREREEPLAAAGAARAETPAAAAANAEAVLTCVSDTPDLEHVLLGPDGVADGLQSGGLVVDCSTVSPAATAAIAAKLRERGIGMVDAPVSGGSEGAEKGTLTIFCGGEEGDVARAGPDPGCDRKPDHPSRPQRRRPGGQGGQPGDDRRHLRERRRGHRARPGRGPAPGAAGGGALGRRGGVVGAPEPGRQHDRRYVSARLQARAPPQGSRHRPRRGRPRRRPDGRGRARRGAGGRPHGRAASATRT